MSRIGKKIIPIPKGVKIDVKPGSVEVQGPKGKLTQSLPPGIGFEVAGDQLTAKTLREDPELGKFHGLARSLVANAVKGVTEGFRKDLEIVGVGYRATAKGPGALELALTDLVSADSAGIEALQHLRARGATLAGAPGYIQLKLDSAAGGTNAAPPHSSRR